MSLNLFFSDETKAYRTPTFVKSGDTVTVRMRTPKGVSEPPVLYVNGRMQIMSYCLLEPVPENRIKRRNYGGLTETEFYETTFEVGEETVSYYFGVKYNGISYEYDKRGLVDKAKDKYLFTVIPNFYVPEWLMGSVMYQIFVDRFCSGNGRNDVVNGEYIYIDSPVAKAERWTDQVSAKDVGRFYGGDLHGVRAKLDYLQKLGVEVIYFNPLFVSPSNHKYDSQDYDHIDPHLAVIVKDGDTG